jgi:GNAT superfamily N-acetyltransferase
MPYSIQLPDGSLVENIPDEITPREAKARIIKAYPQYAPESGDVFVPALKSGVSLAQEAGYALAGRTGLMDEAAAQKAIEEEQAYQQRVFKPTEEGFLEAPVTKTLELLGQSLPFMVLPVAAAGATLALPFTGAAATVAGLGAAGLASGAQFTGTNLLRQMEPTDEAPQGKSIGETDLGDAALAAVPQAALDVLSLRMMPFIRGVFGQVGKDLSEEAARRIASKNLKDVAADYALATGKTMTVEGLTEAAQQSLERLQAGLTMTDEAARDEYLESFIGGAVLGGVLAPPGRYLERRAAQKEVPPETKPEPTATQPTAPTPITDEDELTPEEEADLQARIAAAPPATGLPVAATPTQPLAPPDAVQQVTASPEAVALPGTQQVTPQAAPELEVLTAQLARIQQARMDPTLSPDDPAFLEFDQQEAAIQARIQQLTAPPAAVTQPPAQPLAPPVAPVIEPDVIPEDAIVESEIQVPFDETLTPPGPSLEDQVREQKAEERRERQAAQEAKKGEFVLQNRDRSSTGSIQQMQNIANAPDYSRAGFSRTPDGAPIIAFGDYAPERLGREDVVTTARGRKIPVQYAVVEADEVITSNDIQGRADNRYGDKSVPGPRAIAGNGRITGLRESFERGTATPYVEEMAADSTLHGISPDVIAGMKKPVLVRVMPQEGLTRDIGDELNISSMLELSPVEQAKNDLNRVDFEGLQFNEEGEITNESLSQFIAAQPVEERTKLIDRGLPTKQARQRLENAIFARAYADDDLIAMFAQTEDVEARLVINALAQVAPQMAQLEGAGDLDIRDIVTDAAKIIVSGKRRGLKLKEISAQVDMTVDPDTKIIVDMFAQNPRSNKAAIESLRNAAELAYNESIRPEEGLFGVEPRRERRDIMEQMRRGYEPTRTEDVAEAERPRPAPSDVERKAEPSAATVPPADQGFQLTGQTPEELAELQRKELSGEAEAERDRIEAEEATKAAEIAAKKVAEQKGEQPGDLAPTTGKMELSAPPITDLFGTQGITDQPVRGPRRVAAELSPIEKLAAEKAPTLEDETTERMRQLGVLDFDDASQKVQEAYGVSKPVADAYVRSVRKEAEEIAKSTFGMENEFQKAYDESTKLRNRMEGIRRRKKDKIIEKIQEAPQLQYAQDALAEYIARFRDKLPSTGQRSYDAQTNTITDVVNAKDDVTMPRADFDALVSIAKTLDSAAGKNYSIVVEDTPEKSSIFTFRPRSLKATDTQVNVFAQLEETNRYVEELTLDEQIKKSLKDFGLDDRAKASKKRQEEFGISKPVADALVRADIERMEMSAKFEYGVATEAEYKAASKKYYDLLNKAEAILKQKKAAEKDKPSLPVKKEPEGKRAAKTPLAFYQQMIPDAGFKRLDLDDPRTYKNKSGEEFLTFERDGVRVAVKSNTQLYAADRGVGMYMGKDNDLLIQAMIVDESARRQGKATKALQDILSMADQAGMTSYIEPVQMAKDVGMTTEQLKDFYKRFGFKPQKTEPATDRVMIREPGAKIEAAKQEVEPPTITPGQQRNLNYWRENVAPAIRDYLTAYKNVGVERLERSRFKPEGISATEWLLKLRSQKSVFGKGGRKVSDTGIQMLSKKDLLPTVSGDGEVLRKAMLKAIQAINKAPGYNSDWIENMEAGSYDGIPDFEPRKEEKPKAEQFVRGTEEQLKEIKEFAKRYGGSEVAYYDPDKDIGMVLAFGKFDGDPKYIPYIKGIVGRTAFDISVAKFPEALPYKAELLEIKERLEKAAEKKHQENPFIKFERGIALSDGMDPKIEGIIREWKDMLGLGGINIYFSTTEDAKKNINNFTGPHRRIGSATIDANERGSMRRMGGGASYYVVFDKSTSTTKMLEVIAHEMGHVHEKVAFDQAPQEVKDKLKAAYEKWLEGRKDKTSREAIQMLRAKTTAQTTDIGQTIETAEQLDKLDPYWSKFSEWYADQVSRWAVTDEKPVGVVEKFFARLGAALRRFYQNLKGQGYLPDETFVQYLKQVKPTIVETIPGPIKDPVNQDMSSKMQTDLFGSPQEAKDIGEAMEVKGKKKLPAGRSPELTAAAQAVQAGTMTAEEFNKLVDIYKPIPLYEEPLKPATSEQVFDALDVKKREQINPEIPNGTKVGLRLDIPAFNRKGVFVVSIHQKRTPSAPGKVIGYGSVAKAKNVTFGVGNQLKALEIAAGSAKDALQTMEGDYVNVTPEQALAEAQRAIKDPSYVQIGIDPTRHAYFYDRRTTLPVVSAEEVLQIGNMILAKKPVFGRKQDFLYNIDSAPVQSAAELDAKRDRENQEKLRDLQDLRPTKIALPEKVRSYASSEEGQRVIAALNMTGEELERTVQKQYEGYTADNFMRRARKGLDEGEISADVFAVVQSMYMADPKLLDGLRLDVKQKFTPEELAQRRAEGKPSPMGAFAPFERVVYLYTGTKGVTDPMTIRHELTHTLEQLMTPAQRKAVVNAYIAALKKAAKKHKDAKSREFFDNVVKYLNEPSNDTRDAMNKSLPSLDFYQFTSPSEYWAVNAEKLMAQRLGVPWDRFKKAVRKMFEAMKKLFGFDNRFVVHDVFDKIMSGSKERMDTGMLANFVASSKQEYEMIEKTKEDAELVRRYNRTPTSQTDSAPLRRIMIGAAENSKDLFKSMVESPSEAINFMFNSVNRGVMFLRNKFIWFGSGINEADRIRYNGAVKTAEGLATASVALDNMIRGGNIATQVIMQGGIEFNKNTQMYGAVQKDKSMANVYRAEAKLIEKLGTQLGTDIEQGYLQAKRSRSIIDEVATREKAIPPLEAKEKETNAEIDRAASISKALDADPNTTATQRQASDVALRKAFREHKKALRELQDAQEELKTIKRIREDKVTMSEQEIADFIQREEAHPELKEILDNFNAVNQNLLRFWRDVGLLSEARYNRLSSIKDYVPWYRVMDDDADIHDPVQATTRSATNIGKEKLFKAGKPSVVTDFTVEENQKVFKVQPGAVNAVKLNSIRLKPDQYDVQPNGEITLKVEAKPGQLLVVETQREIENMIDNMTRNVMRMTMNGLRKYAANRIVSEYATREAGKIKRFATADRNKGRFDYIENGRRTIVEIQDPLIAEAVLGMETVGMKMWEPLAAAANFTRRTITLSPVFQLKQVFKDAPTAALVTGVRNPAALMGGVMRDFIGAVRGDDPVAEILRSQGIGGFYSPARTPEADVKRQIGIINNNTYDYVMKALDHFGDSSDMAQRIAIYKRVMAETGDETLALYQAANVINFLRHGSGQVAQALVQTVPFLNAYAQSIDVLYDALRGGGLRGKDRAAALQQLAWTGGLLAGTTLIYAFLVGDDDDYMKMDDQSKIRSYMIPGTDVVLPMNTSAAFFFKAIPELLYNKVANEGTETEVDAKRLRTAMKEAAVDLLLGPTPVPSAVKPIIEIGLDYNFFTSRPVTPRGMQSLDAYQQYDMRTSEAAKILSSLTGTDEKRVLNPMEADHLVRSIFGTAGAMVAWSSNLVGEAAEFRPEMGLKEMPVTGAFLRPEVPRGREDLFYKLKDDTDRKYRTYMTLANRDNKAEAQAYINRHPNLVAYYEYTSEMDAQLKEINSAIRFIGETRDPSYTPEIKRREIQEFLNLKQDILEGIEQFRKEAYAN